MTNISGRLLALVAVTLSLLATWSAEPSAWPLLAIAGFVAFALAWAAFANGSVAAPVVTLLVLALLFVFADGPISVGPLIGSALALVAGETIWSVQALGDQGPAVVRPIAVARSALTTAVTASVAIVVVLWAARLPDQRLWSVAAVGALVALAALTQRRRRTLDHVPLAPPRSG